MALMIKEMVEVKPYTTFRMGGMVAYVAELHSIRDLQEFAHFAELKNLPLLVIGGGSNIIFPDQGTLRACVGVMKIPGFEISKNASGASIQIGAGEEWDSVVKRSVAQDLSGIEALSAISGSTGGTPIQNVGAYGQEIADTLIHLDAYDLVEKRMVTMMGEECNFSYRDSIFKHEAGKKFIVTSITLKLSNEQPRMPSYPGVESYFSKRGVANPSLQEIRQAIIDIRSHKLPDPSYIASCGSFFKNPIVGKEVAKRIHDVHPSAVTYQLADGTYKVGAGWMIDTVGLKGKELGNLHIYPHNALVLVNKGGATRKELESIVFFITEEVKNAFGVTLEPEPVFVS